MDKDKQTAKKMALENLMSMLKSEISDAMDSKSKKPLAVEVGVREATPEEIEMVEDLKKNAEEMEDEEEKVDYNKGGRMSKKLGKKKEQ